MIISYSHYFESSTTNIDVMYECFVFLFSNKHKHFQIA